MSKKFKIRQTDNLDKHTDRPTQTIRKTDKVKAIIHKLRSV